MSNILREQRTYKLERAVLDGSVATNFEEAATEWSVIGYEKERDETCVCGKRHIVRCYRIRNTFTEMVLWPIGCDCILKFGQESMIKDAHDMELAEARRTRAALVAAKKEVARLEEEERDRVRRIEEEERSRLRAIEYAVWEKAAEERERSERLLSTQREEEQRIINEQKKKEARETMVRRAEESRIAQQRATEVRLVTFGKYAGKTFQYISDRMPWYIEYIRENAKRDEFADLVRFHDSRN